MPVRVKDSGKVAKKDIVLLCFDLDSAKHNIVEMGM